MARKEFHFIATNPHITQDIQYENDFDHMLYKMKHPKWKDIINSLQKLDTAEFQQ